MCFMFVISPPILGFSLLWLLTTDPGSLVLVCLHFWCVCVCLTWDLFVFMCSFVMRCVCLYVFVCHGTTSPDSWFYGISLLRLLATDPGPPLSFNTGPARPLQPAIKIFWNISKYFKRWDNDFKRPQQAAIKIFQKRGEMVPWEQSKIYLDLQNNSGADNIHSVLCFLGNILNPLLVWAQYKQKNRSFSKFNQLLKISPAVGNGALLPSAAHSSRWKSVRTTTKPENIKTNNKSSWEKSRVKWNLWDLQPMKALLAPEKPSILQTTFAWIYVMVVIFCNEMLMKAEDEVGVFLIYI